MFVQPPRGPLALPPRDQMPRDRSLPPALRQFEDQRALAGQGELAREAGPGLGRGGAFAADEPLSPHRLAQSSRDWPTPPRRARVRKLQGFYDRDGTAFQVGTGRRISAADAARVSSLAGPFAAHRERSAADAGSAKHSPSSPIVSRSCGGHRNVRGVPLRRNPATIDGEGLSDCRPRSSSAVRCCTERPRSSCKSSV